MDLFEKKGAEFSTEYHRGPSLLIDSSSHVVEGMGHTPPKKVFCLSVKEIRDKDAPQNHYFGGDQKNLTFNVCESGDFYKKGMPRAAAESLTTKIISIYHLVQMR